jgi:hypothetical protein
MTRNRQRENLRGEVIEDTEALVEGLHLICSENSRHKTLTATAMPSNSSSDE